MAGISNDWLGALKPEFSKPYYKDLYTKVVNEYNNYKIFPPASDIYKAFELTPLSKVKVVILGQDPYHNDNQAMGLCFSVNENVEIPPSLQNIYKELNDDLGLYIPNHGNLTKWANEGVLLLNTILTVRAHTPKSHEGIGWERFTDAAIAYLNSLNKPIVYMLWGSPAGKKAEMLNNPSHLVLKAPHPSPLSAYRGFFGCKHFSKANNFLINNNEKPIDWQIENI